MRLKFWLAVCDVAEAAEHAFHRLWLYAIEKAGEAEYAPDLERGESANPPWEN